MGLAEVVAKAGDCTTTDSGTMILLLGRVPFKFLLSSC